MSANEETAKKMEGLFGADTHHPEAAHQQQGPAQPQASSNPEAPARVEPPVSQDGPQATTLTSNLSAGPTGGLSLTASQLSSSNVNPASTMDSEAKRREAKAAGFKSFSDWNKKIRSQLTVSHEVLTKLLGVLQRKNQRNDNRLNFVRAYYNAFLEDMSKMASHQLDFAQKASSMFESKDQQSLPIFEQGKVTHVNERHIRDDRRHP